MRTRIPPGIVSEPVASYSHGPGAPDIVEIGHLFTNVVELSDQLSPYSFLWVRAPLVAQVTQVEPL